MLGSCRAGPGAFMKRLFLFSFVLLTAALGQSNQAAAFCGFYVAGGETSLFNDATQAVLMREGNRTVLSMQNNFDGPPEDFAMVIPVPVVLQEMNVKTLDEALFKKLDQLTSPRLVEYWEQDPCESDMFGGDERASAVGDMVTNEAGGGSVQVEAEFSVGEYDIVILSTDDPVALESWLETNEYNIPDNASPYLNPYVERGSYFFVAKVDPEKVTWAEDGNNSTGAVLSPLRFHYDTDDFSLPIRLGLINSQGDQDLIVYTLANNQRYQVANYNNVMIPTNLDVVDEVRNAFGEFYKTLFDAVMDANPNSVVTEYSWDASTCDPCPGPTLDQNDYQTLGADVLYDDNEGNWRSFVITRLHARYNADNLGDDLVFEEASPIAGGREFLDNNGEIEQGFQLWDRNNFQGRYIIRHPWEGSVFCVSPELGKWGRPPDGESTEVLGALSPNSQGTSANADGEDVLSDDLNDLVITPIPELGIAGTLGNSGCTCQSTSHPSDGLLLVGVGFLFLYFQRRKKRGAI